MKNIDLIRDLSKKHASFYLYDQNTIIESTEALKKCFPGVEFLYSVKCNHHPNVVAAVFGQGFGADAASAQEVRIALQNGLGKDKIYYSAPGKGYQDICDTLEQSNIIADSLSEIECINKIAAEKGIVAEIGIRINPNFTYETEQGLPSKFGIDEDDALSFLKNNSCANIKVIGIHVHIRSQELVTEKLKAYYEKMFKLAGRVEDVLQAKLAYINLGSGIGIPYSSDDDSVDIAWLGAQAETMIAAFRADHPATKIFIEVGRYAVCKSGVYVARVADRKVSHGKTYILVNNTLNGFVRPSIARMVEKYTGKEKAAAAEPLFTSLDAFQFEAITDATELETVTLCGILCTATDVIAEDIQLPKLNIGDCIVISNAGGYAAVLTPMQFSSQTPPAQLMLTAQGEIKE